MRLTPHFDLSEFTTSQTASRKGLDNTPPPEVVARLQDVTAPGLERVRSILGKPLLISSGYRSPAVNKAVGGSKTSAHMFGYAADFICPGFGTPLDVCRALVNAGLKFDQLIQEGTWVHVSFDPRMRQNILTKDGAGGYALGLAA
jgi:hypothetical protein